MGAETGLEPSQNRAGTAPGDPAGRQGSLRPAQHPPAQEVAMSTPARTLAVAVALAALTALPAGAAHAREADEPSHPACEQQASADPTYPAPIYRGPHAAQRTLARTLAREHLAYGTTPVDPASQAAELALIRVLAKEHLAYGTTNN
jgi:hypothetical protein